MLIVSIGMALTLLTSASVTSSLLLIASCILLCELSTLHFSDSHLCVLNSGSWSLSMIQLTVTWSRTISQGSKLWQLSLTFHLSLPDSQVLKTVFSHIFPFLFVSGGRINWSLLFYLGWKWKSLKYFLMWLCQFEYSQAIYRFIFNYK